MPNSSLYDTSVVHVIAGDLAKIDVNPKEATLKLGEKQQFTAAGYDSFNNVISINPKWSTSGGLISVDGLYTATIAGNFIIQASQEGSDVKGTASVSVLQTLDIPQNGLVAYYPFNGNANDESGNGNHGNIQGAVLTSDRFAKSNSAYHFNGSNNLINCGHRPSLQLTDSLTISAWFNSNNTDKLGEYIIGKCSDSTASYEYLICWDFYEGGASWGLKTCVGGENYNEIGSNFVPIPNTWYHVVVTFSYPGYLTLYLNGNILSSISTTGRIEPTTQDLVIGCIRPSGEPTMRFFNGSIDDICIYNRVLSTTEISMLNKPTRVESEPTPTMVSQFTLGQNYPNPFNPTTRIKFAIPVPTHVKLAIHNLLGEEIRILINAATAAGYYEVEWDAKDSRGIMVPTGVYLYSLSTNDYREVRKMILAK